MQPPTRMRAALIAVVGVALFSGTVSKAIAATPSDVIAVAETQVGVGESPPGSDLQKYGLWNGVNGRPWCSEFASWCAHMAGARTAIGGRFSSARRHVEYFRSAGTFGSIPRVGAYIFFDTDEDGVVNHVGIVTSVNSDGSVNTIEGNTSGMVRRRTRSRNIVGYGYPAYSAASTSDTYYWVQMHTESIKTSKAIERRARLLDLAVRSARSADDGHITLVAHASAAKAETLKAFAAALGQPMQTEGTKRKTFRAINTRLTKLVSEVYER